MMDRIRIGSEDENHIFLINKFGNQYKGANNRIIVLPFIANGIEDRFYFKNQDSGYWELITEETYNQLENKLAEFRRISEESISKSSNSIIVDRSNFDKLDLIADEIENLKSKLYSK